MSSAGPTMPPARMAAASQGRSRSGGVAVFDLRTASQAARPRPLPRYKRPASASGATEPTSSLANGVLAPNSAAESKA